MLAILVPPAIALMEFKNKKELGRMPVTFEEHEQVRAKKDHGAEESGDEEKLNGTAVQFAKDEPAVTLR